MDPHRLSEEQRQAVASYVERRRRRLNLMIKEAAEAGGLSERKWHQVEAATHNHQERTLRLVAKGLAEPPRRLLELAGYRFEDDVDDEPGADVVEVLVRRIERLEPLPREVASLRAEVRELVSVVRSVHHAAPPGPPAPRGT